MKKRVFSAALAGCMMLTMVPVTAFAASEEAGVAAVEADTYEAAAPSFELLKANATNKFVGNMEARDFVDLDGTVKLKKGYVDFNETLVADQSGYYLPLVLHIPGATTETDVVLKEGHSEVQEDGSIVKVDKVLDGATEGLWDNNFAGGEGQINLVKQIARMDGELLGDKKLVAEVWLEGYNGAADPVVVEYDYSGAKLEDSAKYKNAELELYTSNAVPLDGVKRSRDFYDVSSQTVKLVADKSGYYLPLQLTLDTGVTSVVKVKTAEKNQDGTNKMEVVAPVSNNNGTFIFLQKIAGVDGKKLQDEVEVTIYPQGDGKGMPSKTCTYDLADVKMEEGLAIGLVPVKKEDVTVKDQATNLAIKNNLDQVQSIVLKDGVLTIKVNSDLLVTVPGHGEEIPVLFTKTLGGKSAVAADGTVTQFGGVSKTHQLEWIDLTSNGSVTFTAGGVSETVTVKVVDVTDVPALKSSAPVTAVEAGSLNVLEGFTAQKTAVATAGELKDMFDAKEGSVIVTNAAGVELAADDEIRTGTMVVLKDGKTDSAKVVETFTVVVKGDVTGSGTANAGQIVAIGRAVVGTQPLKGAYALAGDLNNSGKIDAGDIVAIGRMVVGMN